MTTIPYPTPNRLKLADAIAAGKVRHYPFQTPETYNDITGNLVTSRFHLLLSAGLVEVPEPDEHNYSIVRLTPEGMAWVTRARTAGPGSTSPEPGRCPTCESRQPSMHPAAGAGGEVTRLCPDAFHAESTKDSAE